MFGIKKAPSTFEIALGLTMIVFVMALFITKPTSANFFAHGFNILKYWQKGFWELLEFTLQMVLILIFGHALAISKPIKKRLFQLAALADTNTKAVLITGITAIVGGLLNWGFGLILGAVLAKQIGIESIRRQKNFNYPLIVASGYLGMLVWHGGLSGSAPLKVAEPDHFLVSQIGSISVKDTIFSDFNLMVNAVLVILLITLLYFLSKKEEEFSSIPPFPNEEIAIEKIGSDKWGIYLGIIILGLALSDIFLTAKGDWSFVDLNYINFMLLGAGLMAFRSLQAYVQAIGIALKGATDILIQFPFYAGILGIMKYSGLLLVLSGNIVSSADADTFPLLSFLSAAIINLFVPSGGGQWAIQGPVIMDAADKMGLQFSQMIVAFSYGDQVTNMLQPFWALPLLAITGVEAKKLFKYTVWFFLVGFLVFGLGIYFWVR